MIFGQRQQSRQIFRRDSGALDGRMIDSKSFGGNARVARHAIKAGDPRRLRQLPSQRVFTSARPNNQYFHNGGFKQEERVLASLSFSTSVSIHYLAHDCRLHCWRCRSSAGFARSSNGQEIGSQKDGSFRHFRWRRRRSLLAGIKGRGSFSAVWIIRLKSSRLAVEALAWCSSKSRRPARMTSDLLLKRPEATKRSISCSKCGVITLLMRKLLSNCSHLLSTAAYSHAGEALPILHCATLPSPAETRCCSWSSSICPAAIPSPPQAARR
jgi:hypothetical protein